MRLNLDDLLSWSKRWPSIHDADGSHPDVDGRGAGDEREHGAPGDLGLSSCFCALQTTVVWWSRGGNRRWTPLLVDCCLLWKMALLLPVGSEGIEISCRTPIVIGH
jgi:hypothetical protein